MRKAIRRIRNLLTTRNPKTFSDKLRYKLYRDRRPLLVTFADKVAARGYVASKTGSDLLLKAYAILSDAEELANVELPRNYVLKASHGSGGVIVIWEGADPRSPLPTWDMGWKRAVLHPDQIGIKDLIKTACHWLSQPYPNMSREWFYKEIPPRIIVEELLQNENGGLPNDYKFFVFHGITRWTQVDSSRFFGHSRDVFTPRWNPLPVVFNHPRAATPPPPPRNLDRMFQIANELGAETDFVRVDLYDCGDRVVFGELTNCPEGGGIEMRPAEFDLYLGQWWNPPPHYAG